MADDIWQSDYETWLKESAANPDMPPPFNAQMPTPRTPKNQSIPGIAWLSRMDAKLQNWVFSSKATNPGFAYLDVRGKWWSIRWSTDSFTWTAYPLTATANEYNAEFGTTAFAPKRQFAAATDAEGIISAINERVEALRPSNAPGEFPWLLLLVVAMVIASEKKR